MSSNRRNGEIRAIIGSGYLAGDKDLRDAGPIPKAAGVKVVSKTNSKDIKRTARKRPTK